MNASEDKASSCNAGDPGSIPGLGRSPGEGNVNPLQYSCHGESHGQRSLVGYSPWGHKELDPTERLHTHTDTHTHEFKASLDNRVVIIYSHSKSSLS